MISQESIKAMGFKLGQLMEDDKYINWLKFKEIYFMFFELSAFADLDLNIAVTLKLSLQLVLLRAKKSFPHFIGYQNFINDLTKLVSSQTLAYVQLRVCLKYLLLVLLLSNIIGRNIVKKHMKGKE